MRLRDILGFDPSETRLIETARMMDGAFKKGDGGKFIRKIEYDADQKTVIVLVTRKFITSPKRKEMEKNFITAWREYSKSDIPVVFKQ